MSADIRYFQKGFGLKAEVQDQLSGDYHSGLIAGLKESGYELRASGLVIRLAREFGFCYGVDRAIDYAYETRQKFPDRRIFLVGEIIHNPGVNARLTEMGIRFLTGEQAEAFDELTAEDVVIIPAFGVKTTQMDRLRDIGCVRVDTTCGSVLNVWKRVGVANQTTMLMSESLEIARRLQRAMTEQFGAEHAESHFRSFDTICSATQDRQDAVFKLLGEGVDVMIVIGGYNSSNTANLARICAERVPTYHVATSTCLGPDGAIRHLPAGTKTEVTDVSWLPEGDVRIGVTAGASTPDSEVGSVIERVLALRSVAAS